ncbi:translocation/assembly module TamB domain-containing protein [Pararhodospirillum oryzae]|uniref:Translocation/assembly module TamB n=1 Tax=Pararhodospirillum oryzae TaxID=478448 RepID=A0A512H897_9PROT|nr:translocation/assembly module TamB domain-containing protein [Pararhodospirillum oryzae]GEO81648.1 translocation/assembly module TamB [Pararhodospirillum oryzae]
MADDSDTKTPASSAPAPGSRRRRRAWRVLGATVALVTATPLALGGAGALWLDSAAGHAWLSQTLESLVDDPTGVRLRLDTVEGSLWGDLRITGLVLEDPAGPWLTLPEARLAWSPAGLLGGRLVVRDLELRRPVFERLPETQPSPEEDTSEGLDWLALVARVRLERLAVEGLEVGEALAGQRVRLDVDGGLDQGTAPGSTRVHLDAVRTDGVPGALAGDATLARDPLALDLDLRLVEPAGGALGGLLGLADRPAVDVRIEGSGPLADWPARITASVEDVATLAGTVRLGWPDLRAGLDVRLVPGPKAPPMLAAGAGPEGMRILGDVALPGEGAVHLDELLAEGAGWRVHAKGGVEAGETGALTLDADVNLDHPPALALVAPTLEGGTAHLAVSARGTRARPRVDARLDAGALALPDVMALEGLGLVATLAPDPATAGALALSVTGGPQGLSLPAAGAGGAALVGPAPAFVVRAFLDPDGGPLRLETASVSGAGFDLDVSGRYDPAQGRAEAVQLVLAVPDLAPLSPGLGLGARLEAHAEALAFGPGGAAGAVDLGVALSPDPARLDPALAELLGPTPALSARVSLGGEGDARESPRVRLQDLKLETNAVTGTGEGTLEAGDTLAARLTLAVANPALLGAGLGGGPLTLSVDAKGAIADPTVVATLEGARLSGLGPVWEGLRVRVEAASVTQAPTGRVEAEARAGRLPVRLSLPFAVEKGFSALVVEDATLTAGSASVTARAHLDPARLERATARVNVAVPDLAVLAPLGVPALGGRLDAQARLEPDRAGKGVVTLEARAPGLRLNGQGLGRLEAKARVDDPLAKPAITASVSLAGGGSGPVSWRQLGIEARGPLDSLGLAARVEGALRAGATDQPLKGRLDARWKGGAAPRLEVSTLDVSAGTHRVALAAPTAVRLGGGTTRLEETRLTVDRGQLTLAGGLGANGRVQARLEAAAVPLGLADLFAPTLGLEGRLEGTVNVAGTPSRPTGKAALVVRQLRAGALAGHRVDAFLEATVDRALTASLRLEGLPGEPLQAQARLPLPRGLAAVGPGTPVDAWVRWKGDIHDLWDMTPLIEHRPSGPTTVDLSVAGTVGAPRLSGGVRLEKGRYENLLTGTLLKDLDLDVSATADQRLVVRLRGTDGGPGTVALDGALDLSSPGLPQGDVKVAARNATLVRRDEATATLDADLTLALRETGAALAGTVTTQKVAVRLINSMGASIPDLPVMEVGGRGQPATRAQALAARARGEDARNPGLPVALDLKVSLPNRVYVTGQGVNTEWKGALTVGGTAAQPVVVGTIENLRGQVDFLGRTFSLKDSVIRFDGGRRLDPGLDIRATNDTGDVTAVVRVTGTASAPDLSFSSEPALPPDEVVAHILFGKSSGELSAIEAVQLARAVGELGGFGTGGSFVESLRDATGLDVLKLGEGDKGGTTVQAGTYVRENVYVGVVQGMGLGDSAVEVQVELTPSLNLETRAGAGGAGEAGLFWKRDY